MIRLISIAIEILSVIGLLYGYGNKSRNIMFLCGLLLLLGGPVHNHIRGLILGQVPGSTHAARR